MLTPTRITSVAAAVLYYIYKALENYFLNKHEKTGIWNGTGVEGFNLEREVREDQFRNLLHGFSEDGKTPLVQNAGSEKRQCAWDLCLSAPKAVSLLWALLSEVHRSVVLKAHEDAVRTTIEHIEQVCGSSRRGPGGRILEPVALAFACFTHFTSRSLDMALHTHCVLPNVGIRGDGTTGALYSNKFYEMKLELGRFYRDQLALNLQQTLGLTIEQEKVGFHIKGVPKELCREFSKRRRAIVKEMERVGATGGVAAKVAALNTRQKKQQVPLETLFLFWEKTAASHGFARVEAEQLINNARQALEMQSTQLKVANLQSPLHARPAGNPSPFSDDGSAKSSARKTGEHSSKGGERSATQSQSTEHRKSSSASAEHKRAEKSVTQERGEDKSKSGEFKEEATAYHTSGRTNKEKTRSKTRVKSRNREADKSAENSQTKADKKKKGWIRIEKRLLFPNAPDSNPLKYATASVVVIGDKRKFRRWGDIMWKKDMKVFQLRVQWKQMFPNSPAWSPAKFAQIPALRVLSPSQLRKAQQAKKNAERQEERLNHSH